MRALLDTNVLVSGVFFGGTPARVVAAVAEGRVSLVLSLEILDEYRRVGRELERRYPKLRGTFEPIVALLVASATVVDAPSLPEPVSADPDDDKFLTAAGAAAAAVIVSGDRHLLEVAGWRGIRVLTPRQFVDEVLAPE